MEFNTLTLTLHNFIAVFSGGFGRLSGAVNGLLAVLGGIDLVLLGLWWALGGGEQLVAVFKKLLYIGLWIWLCRSFPTISKAFVDSLVRAGFMAGGGGGGPNLIMDPSRIAGYGLDATEPLVKKLEDLGMTDLSDLLVFGFAYVAILGCYLLMAINVFLAVLEYYLFAAVVGILMPFGLLSSTKFLAEKAIGAVVASGVKLMVLSFLIAVIEPVVRGLHFAGDEIAMNELWAMFLTICALLLLCWKAPHLASSLLAGSPSLAGQDVTSPALLAAGGAIAGVAAARRASSVQSSENRSAQAASSLTSSSTGLGFSDGSRPGAAGAAASTAGSGSSLSGPALPRASATLVKSVSRGADAQGPTRLVRPAHSASPPNLQSVTT